MHVFILAIHDSMKVMPFPVRQICPVGGATFR